MAADFKRKFGEVVSKIDFFSLSSTVTIDSEGPIQTTTRQLRVLH